jgi:hypothetical protein
MPFDGVHPDAVQRVWNRAGLLDSIGLATAEDYNPWIPPHLRALRSLELLDRHKRVLEDWRRSKKTYLRTGP